MKATVDLSIIIVTSQRDAQVLRGCLDSVRQQTHGVTYEVLVSDNASLDDCPGLVRREFPRARVIENGSNMGFSKANNAGLRQAQGRYVVFLNPDTIVVDDALTRMVRVLEAHPEVGVLGCRLLNTDHSLQPSCYSDPSLLQTVLGNLGLARWLPRRLGERYFAALFFAHDRFRYVDWLMGACLMMRRGLAERLNGFDEGFSMYSEDLDLCVRARQLGVRNAFTPEARIIHLGGTSNSQRWSRVEQAARKYEAMCVFYRKRYGRGRVFAYRAVTALGSCLRLAVWSLPALVCPPCRARLRFQWAVLRTVTR